MNELKIINNPMFGEIRLFPEPDKPLFCGVDVARPLGYKNIPDALARHCPHIVKRYIGVQTGTKADGSPAIQEIEVGFIPEGDVYRLIARSKLPEAVKFESWIFDEVLPSIRKTGGYIAGQDTLTDAELMAKALLVAQRTIEARETRIHTLESDNRALTETNAALTAQIEADAPRVMWAKAAEGSKDGMLIREFCKFLRPLGIEIGEKRMFADLRKRGWLIKAEGRDKNKPTQRAVEMGLFTVRERTISTSDGETLIKTTPLLTEKGKQYFTALYLKEARVNAAVTA